MDPISALIAGAIIAYNGWTENQCAKEAEEELERRKRGHPGDPLPDDLIEDLADVSGTPVEEFRERYYREYRKKLQAYKKKTKSDR